MSKATDKKVSINAVEKLVCKHPEFTIDIPHGEDTISITVYPYINLKERLEFVHAIADNVANAMTDTGEPISVYAAKDFFIRIHTLRYFTNMRLPEDTDKQYEFAYYTGIYETIINHVSFCKKIYAELLDSIDKQIEYEIMKTRSRFELETEDFLEHIKFEAEKLMETFETITASFKGVNQEEVSRALKNIADMPKLDGESLVKAVAEVNTKK